MAQESQDMTLAEALGIWCVDPLSGSADDGPDPQDVVASSATTAPAAIRTRVGWSVDSDRTRRSERSLQVLTMMASDSSSRPEIRPA